MRLVEQHDLRPDQIYVKNLIIDDCGMKDADFAALLRSISIQGKLKSITYANNEFREESVEALCGIIQREQSPPTVGQGSKQPEYEFLESLKLCNLRCDQSGIQNLLRVMDE